MFTRRETGRAGLARHDRLTSVAGTTERDAIVIVPTWRQFLLGKVVSSTNEK
ncbi:hypothetical protein [Sanguibacter sp. HDW7]|uniref:hypothetical protein n=1 Tax=Sanguibacter sp. HDW7 TaxID=2714931 RepID=UPI00140DCA79|nr:hypothetical protein [Sanguibacter sp. HDW7]QIK82871.1 hypothetical protein G7063_03950 [Sanguibacter sp. HDW7]